jgi:hypothetical protein
MISKIQVQVMADRLPGVHDTCYLYASTGPQIRPRERIESPRRLPLPLTRLNSLCLCCSIRGGVRASCHCRHRLSSPCAIVFEPPALPSCVECHRTPLYLIVTLVVPCYFGSALETGPCSPERVTAMATACSTSVPLTTLSPPLALLSVQGSVGHGEGWCMTLPHAVV